jgi:hypothetical protein
MSPTTDTVWDELEQHGAPAAIVRFHGGAGKPGEIAAVTLEDTEGGEISRWSSGEGRRSPTSSPPGLGPLRIIPRSPEDHRHGPLGRGQA